MRRFLKITLVVVVVLAALLVVNAVVLDKQTRPAEVTVAGGKLIEVSNAELQYVDRPATGAGPEGEPIVLLHCFACSQQWWDPLVPLLNESHRLISFDLIGFGGSEKPSSGYEIEAQSAAVAEALNELGVRQATVVGHSMGGEVATSLAEQSSDLVDRIVLIATASEPGDSDPPFLADAATLPVLGEGIWRLRLDSLVKSSYASSFAPGADVSELFEDPDRVVIDSGDMTFGSFKASSGAADDFVAAGSIASRLMATGVPVLAMDGAEDQVLDPDHVLSEYQAIPGARIVTIEDAGHSPNVEQPQDVADAILSFADAGGPVIPPSPTEPRPAPRGRVSAAAKKEHPMSSKGSSKGPHRRRGNR
ncbi:MAG: alpha/beta hydrolase [Solirubrobacterales bacterium]|nr:alpha/beta hydrolase [Solirubrobacterales bacterium]